MMRRLLALASAMIASAPGLAAAASPAITIDPSPAASRAQVAVADDGTAHIAWMVTSYTVGIGDTVRYCRLPRGATACNATMSWIPDDQGSNTPFPLVRTNGTIQIVAGRDGSTSRTWLMASTTNGTSWAAPKQIGDIGAAEAVAGPGLNNVTGYQPAASPLGDDKIQVMATNAGVTTARAAFPVQGHARSFKPGLGLLNSTTPVFAYTQDDGTFVRKFNNSGAYSNAASWGAPVEVPGHEDLIGMASRVGVAAYVLTHTEVDGNALKDVLRVRQVNENNGGLSEPKDATVVGEPRDGTLALDASGTLTSVWSMDGDESPIRAASAPPGGAFGAASTLVASANVYNLAASTAPDRGGLVVWDGNHREGVSAAAIPAGGPIPDPLPTPPPNAGPPPAAPPAGPAPIDVPTACKLEIKPGIVATARGGVPGCWVEKPKNSRKYSYDGTIDVNGLVLAPPSGKKSGVELDLDTKILTASDGVQQKAGSVILSSRKVDWNFAKTNVQRFSKLETAAGGKPIKLLGFPVVGDAEITFGDGFVDIAPYLEMPFPFDGYSAGTKMRVTQAGGLELEGLNFGIKDAMIGPLRVQDLKVVTADGIGNFLGSATVLLPLTETKITVSVAFSDGELTQFSASVLGLPPIPVGTPIVNITGLGFNYENNATFFRVGGGAELAFPSGTGPFYFNALGVPPGSGTGFSLTIDKKTDTAQIHFGGRFEAAIGGTRLDIGGLDADLDTKTGTFTLGVDVHLGSDLIGIKGAAKGAVNLPTGAFYVEGKIEVCLLACLADLEAIVSSKGAAGCAKIGYDPFVLRLMVGMMWNGDVDAGMSCNLGPYKPAIFKGGAGTVIEDPPPSKNVQLTAADTILLPSKLTQEETDDLGKPGRSKDLVEKLNETTTASVEVQGDGGLPGIELTEVRYSEPVTNGDVVTKAKAQPYSPTDRIIATSDLSDLKKPVQVGDVIMVPSDVKDHPSVRITFVQRGQKLLDAQPSNLPTRSVRIRRIGGAGVKFGVPAAPAGSAQRLRQQASGIGIGVEYEPTRVKAKLGGKGRSRTISWDATNLGASGRSIDFIEESSKGSFKVIKSTTAAKGSARFTPADGPAGKRKVSAVVKNFTTLPVDTQQVASYIAPAPPRPGRAKKLRFSLSKKGALKVSWSGTAGASEILVGVKVADGRRFLMRTKKRSIVVPGVAKNEKVSVTVTGLTKAGARGPAVTAKRGRG